mgnify:CR=1 FL=1
MIPNVLSVAGVDPSGGAGVLADVKTFSALGAYGTAVITALTAQNTQAVTGIHPVPPPFVAQQIATLLADVRLDAAKTGMLGTAPIVTAVAQALAPAIKAQRLARRSWLALSQLRWAAGSACSPAACHLQPDWEWHTH